MVPSRLLFDCSLSLLYKIAKNKNYDSKNFYLNVYQNAYYFDSWKIPNSSYFPMPRSDKKQQNRHSTESYTSWQCMSLPNAVILVDAENTRYGTSFADTWNNANGFPSVIGLYLWSFEDYFEKNRY